ncbi:hypothetical protein GCM10009123_08310 [Kangiella japonica]|uniref:TonB-dependent receptor-like beta-barrel domain-containing protein n=1 Tax=Kangiella japonica TaxID=647384 RepID=A0ABN0SW88_9GAMM
MVKLEKKTHRNNLSDVMKSKYKIKVGATLLLASMGCVSLADDSLYQSSNDWTPYTFDSASDALEIAPGTETLYSTKHSNREFNNPTDTLSFGIEDATDGTWKFSLDLNQPQEDIFGTEQYRVHTAYSPSGDNSTFYINYGNRRVPVSIKVEDLLSYEQPASSAQGVSFGLEQNLNDSWAVSISYTKSELEQRNHENSLFGVDQSSITNQKYWFDLNRDGLPESVSLFSELGATEDYNKAFEGIEIRLSRQINDKLSIGGAVTKAESKLEWQPFQFESLSNANAVLDESGLSIFSQLDLSPQWSMDAQLSHNSYQKNHAPIVSLASDSVDTLSFDSTTLDIGVQYQGRWDDVGLVIRIDLVNLLGGNTERQSGYNLYDTGLSPYTFETPKYIKLSGSINF